MRLSPIPLPGTQTIVREGALSFVPDKLVQISIPRCSNLISPHELCRYSANLRAILQFPGALLLLRIAKLVTGFMEILAYSKARRHPDNIQGPGSLCRSNAVPQS